MLYFIIIVMLIHTNDEGCHINVSDLKLFNLITVSYTHLDVYKRQGLYENIRTIVKVKVIKLTKKQITKSVTRNY